MAMDDNNIHAVRGTGQSQEISQKFDLYFTASKSRECIAKGSRHVLQSNCAGDTTFRKWDLVFITNSNEATRGNSSEGSMEDGEGTHTLLGPGDGHLAIPSNRGSFWGGCIVFSWALHQMSSVGYHCKLYQGQQTNLHLLHRREKVKRPQCTPNLVNTNFGGHNLLTWMRRGMIMNNLILLWPQTTG